MNSSDRSALVSLKVLLKNSPKLITPTGLAVGGVRDL
jgi:hypothetical protein